MDKKDMELLNKHYDTPGVYCLTHNPTRKRYIGSSVHIGKRVWNGLAKYQNSAMKNILIFDLSISILEICPKDIPYLRVREADWIDQLRTFYPHGFNIANPLENEFIKSKTGRTEDAMTEVLNLEEKTRLSYLEIDSERRIQRNKFKIKEVENPAEGLKKFLEKLQSSL